MTIHAMYMVNTWFIKVPRSKSMKINEKIASKSKTNENFIKKIKKYENYVKQIEKIKKTKKNQKNIEQKIEKIEKSILVNSGWGRSK